MTTTEGRLTRRHFPTSRKWQPALDRSKALEWGEKENDAVERAMVVFRQGLVSSQRALQALDDNGISRTAMGHFGLGFVERAAGKGIPKGETYEGAVLRGRLQDVGIMRMSGCLHFAGSIVAPVRNAVGKIVDIYGRKISPKLRFGTPYHTCIYDPPQGVFNLQGLLGAKEVVLCGDLLDALAFWSSGVRHVTTTVGPRGFTDLHLEVFEAIGIRHVVLALPPGREDDKTARSIAQALDSVGIYSGRVSLPRDVANTALLAELVRNAVTIWQDADGVARDVRL